MPTETYRKPLIDPNTGYSDREPEDHFCCKCASLMTQYCGFDGCEVEICLEHSPKCCRCSDGPFCAKHAQKCLTGSKFTFGLYCENCPTPELQLEEIKDDFNADLARYQWNNNKGESK